MSDTPRIPVFYFHSVAPVRYRNWVKSFLTLELRYLDELLKFLKRKHFRTISLRDYYQLRKNSKKVPSDTICLTLDDGYADCWIYVYPLLKKYGFKATVFVAPECVDPGQGIRKNLDDHWSGRVSYDELPVAGYLRWDEMREMITKGVIDVQSHTMTHTKYFITDKLTGFHHPGSRNVYPVWNMDILKKPFYMDDPDYMKNLPFGYPLFEEGYAVTARKVMINSDFNNEVIQLAGPLLKDGIYNFEEINKQISPVYEKYKSNGKLVVHRETDEEYGLRLDYEIKGSKKILEERLGHKVEFCCWPHGGNNEYTHQKALESGYLATTKGKCNTDPDDVTRIERIGFGASLNSPLASNLKALYRLRSFQGKFPYSLVDNIYKRIK